MSTIVTSNISDGTDTVGTEYVVNGSAKSWVNFDGTGTVSIRESLNVSSITDNGTGDYTVNFDTALEDANYAIVGTTSTFVDNVGVVSSDVGATNFDATTSSFRINTRNTGRSSVDFNAVSIAVFR